MSEKQMRAAEEEFLETWKRGPTRLRWSKLPPQVGDPAPDLELQDSNDRWVNLRDFWSDRSALLLFWRHYGCGCGLERATRLRKEYADYVAAGANVVVIGQGEPERATAYAAKYGIPCLVLCDPEFQAYEAYGLLEGKPLLFLYDAPEDLQRREDDATQGLIDGRREAGRPLVDDPWQLPGEFVVDR
ncbi:MAG: peroxiredoxin-like family protein, partial [Candidatus Geothermarchaeales archaeon]